MLKGDRVHTYSRVIVVPGMFSTIGISDHIAPSCKSQQKAVTKFLFLCTCDLDLQVLQ